MYQVEDIRRRGETVSLDVSASTWQNLNCSNFGIHFQNASRGRYYGYGQIFTISYTHL